MTLRRPLHLWLAWTACVAVLMASLAPALSQAWQAIGPAEARSGWAEVCSALGTRWVRTDEGSTAPAPAGDPMAHCPYCAWHAPWIDGPASRFSLPPLARSSEQPLTQPRGIRPRTAWPSAQARAPPPSPLA